jgi:hypothetical protein
MDLVVYDQAGNGTVTAKDFTLANGQITTETGVNDLALELDEALQPVQVSWQAEPGSPPDYPPTDDMQRVGERRWQARLPMIVNKETLLFGYRPGEFEARQKIRLLLKNYSFQQRTARVEFVKSLPFAGRERIALTESYSVPAAPAPGSPGVRDVELTAPLPATVPGFQFDLPGNWELIASLTDTTGTALSDLNPANDRVTVPSLPKKAASCACSSSR